MQPTLTASGLNIYSRKNLHKTKDGAYVNILHKYKLIKTHWIALYVNGNNWIASSSTTYVESFGVEHISK